MASLEIDVQLKITYRAIEYGTRLLCPLRARTRAGRVGSERDRNERSVRTTKRININLHWRGHSVSVWLAPLNQPLANDFEFSNTIFSTAFDTQARPALIHRGVLRPGCVFDVSVSPF